MIRFSRTCKLTFISKFMAYWSVVFFRIYVYIILKGQRGKKDGSFRYIYELSHYSSDTSLGMYILASLFQYPEQAFQFINVLDDIICKM